MRAKHQDIFAKFSATFKPETIERWENMVKEWELNKNKPNLFAEPINSPLRRRFAA
jgi:hypothetical protein